MALARTSANLQFWWSPSDSQAAFIQGVLLNPQAPVTLLAPLNSAFNAFLHDAGLSLDQLLSNPTLLKQVRSCCLRVVSVSTGGTWSLACLQSSWWSARLVIFH
jgi:hypothetical protein